MTDLAEKIEPPAKQLTIRDYIEQQGPAIQAALPQHLDVERFTRIVLTEIRRTPKLMKCSTPSVLAAVMLSAQYGLEPGPSGHVYLIPYGQECKWILGFRGMIELARRSGQISTIQAFDVHEADEFDFEYGTSPRIIHKPVLTDRGPIIAYYAVATYKDGGNNFVVLSNDEINERRTRSASSKAGKGSPWDTDFAAMARKTTIRYLSTYLPQNPEFASALEREDSDTPLALEQLATPDVIDVEEV